MIPPDRLRESLRRLCEPHPEVGAIYLFGSQAQGTARPDSDLDLGVLYASPQPLARTLALEEELERALGERVEVVDAARASPFVALDIVRGERLDRASLSPPIVSSSMCCAAPAICSHSSAPGRRHSWPLADEPGPSPSGRRCRQDRRRPANVGRHPQPAARRLGHFTADPRMVAAGDSYLRLALEALLDLARHVLAKGFGRGPAEYAEVARQLGEVGVVGPELAGTLGKMARYRNRMVHFYDEIGERPALRHPDGGPGRLRVAHRRRDRLDGVSPGPRRRRRVDATDVLRVRHPDPGIRRVVRSRSLPMTNWHLRSPAGFRNLAAQTGSAPVHRQAATTRASETAARRMAVPPEGGASPLPPRVGGVRGAWPLRRGAVSSTIPIVVTLAPHTAVPHDLPQDADGAVRDGRRRRLDPRGWLFPVAVREDRESIRSIPQATSWRPAAR